jgi:hypothetical protein
MAEFGGGGGGFFGGLASGMDSNRTNAIAQEELRQRDERQKFAEGRQASSDATTNLTNTLEFIKEYSTNLRAAGNDETKIAAALKPFIESARTVAPKAGLDPDVVAHRALMVATVPQQSAENANHKIVRVAGAPGEPDSILRVEAKTGNVVPIDRRTGQPMLGESDVITPRQAQVANPAAVVNDRFPAPAALGPAPATAPPPPPPLPPAKAVAGLDGGTIDFLARQMIAGNERAHAGTPRGKSGEAARSAIMNRMAEIARHENIPPERLNSAIAEFNAHKSGTRKVGERGALVDLAANEWTEVSPILLKASAAVDRTKYSDINKILLSYHERTGDPAVVQLGAALNTAINVYSRAVSPTGQVTVSDKDHAREILQKSWSKGQVESAVKILDQEIQAALRSTKKTLEHQRGNYTTSVPGAKQPKTETPAPDNDPLGIR